ncbi:CO2+/MG2+ efflux protein ApaG [Nitritalea halalkaliphila LW7]|uniref:CO2+/MG2+ efflux protein ApaG n=1 Tax=Nitritalea halalkaliphila LW7 TaxID=1189621 RepID=I5BU39_9BACT|nr:Co2+/Mg2+ efflux protein ApaG [Nitritalea halalkaliphila]EIM73091.1 CO2+/MG2+ efflux protein ApaG [Nitritalea halalkaliphila LW7]
MVSAITEGIKVSVRVQYQRAHSSPWQQHYVFTYHVEIENNSPYTVQLLRRKWEIFDAADSKKIVEGEGVVGQQPTLEPGEKHAYVSGCNLKSGLGKMLGTYTMERIVDGQLFDVNIPEFQLLAEDLQN